MRLIATTNLHPSGKRLRLSQSDPWPSLLHIILAVARVLAIMYRFHDHNCYEYIGENPWTDRQTDTHTHTHKHCGTNNAESTTYLVHRDAHGQIYCQLTIPQTRVDGSDTGTSAEPYVLPEARVICKRMRGTRVRRSYVRMLTHEAAL